ncbi:MAG: hypothetical protein M1833_002838 [Piccolia ochrophora]|nr:MAG: hypothetical protein M1833_002838 [Piccolia ochrophora]
MGISGTYGEKEPDEQRFKVLDGYYDLGGRFLDTADVYSDSEDLIGEWFKRTGKRDDVFLATKFAMGVAFVDGQPQVTLRSDPAYVPEACEKSLKRLGVSHIDLYYCHRVDGKTPIEETVKAMAQLKKEGKIRHLGLSEVSSETLRRAHVISPISCVQMEYSLMALDVESPQHKLLQTCRELGVAMVCYSPLGRGFIAGKIKSPKDFGESDFRKMLPRYSEENFPKNLELVNKVSSIADKKGCTNSQLALAWLLAEGSDIIPIPGTRSLKYLKENMSAADVSLTQEERDGIRQAAEAAQMQGERWPEGLGDVFADTPPLQ